MKFWKIEAPDYESDYKHTYINGSAEHPFSLPGVNCESCGQTWGGGAILPYLCPQELQKRREIIDGWPISGEKHKKLRDEVKDLLEKDGYNVQQLEPGNAFQPIYLNIPSIPKADFLWSTIFSVIISERIKNLFEKNGFTGVEYCPATFKKIGKRNAKLPPPMPSTGEPEDIINEVKPLEDIKSIGKYYEMVVMSESKAPKGLKVKSVCELCGRVEYDEKTRQFTMTEEMWNGQDIFFLATTAWIIITDKVKDQLEKIEATNIKIKPIQAETR